MAIHPDDLLSAVDARTEEYRKQAMDLQARLLDAHDTINQLNQEKVELLKKNFELEKEVLELRRKLEI